MFVVNGLVSTEPTAKGKVKVCTTKDGDATYLQYMGEGGLLTSDLIKKGQVIYAKKTTAEQGQLKMKEATLSLKKDSLAAGVDYIVDIVVSNYIALGEESTLVKFGAVHATSSMQESDFYVALAKSFARNFSREVNKFFKFYLEGDSREEVTVTSKHTGEYSGVTIVELPQTADYVVGEVAVKPVYFNVVPHTIISDGDEVIPFENVTPEGVIELTDSATLYVGNGYALADTEYFCMGERGDIYRQMGYPRTIRTKYMIIDPTQEYDVIDIAFYFVGRGVDAQKSEKHLTLVGTPSAIQDIAAALDSALGTELAEVEAGE
jgi:hypothetical protein